MTLVHQSNSRFPANVDQVLRGAGWYPGRALSNSELEPWLALKPAQAYGYQKIHPAALRVLREFDGLHVQQDAPGVTRYRESFHMNPLEFWFTEGDWIRYEWLIEDTLFPIGVEGPELDEVLAITPRGTVYSMFPIKVGIGFLGETFDQALINLIEGYGSKEVEVPDYKTKAEEYRWVRDAVRRLYLSE